MARSESDREAQSQTVAEYVFLSMMVLMVAVPASGFVLSAQSGIAGLFAKGAYQLQSTKDLAQRVLDSSNRIHALERKLAQNELELSRLRQQSRDTNNLRDLLNLKKRSERTSVAAEVVARSPDNWYSQVILDKGTSDKIVKGSAVISVTGVVGQVVSASDHACVVRLLTDPEQKLGVLISRLGLTGILVGNYDKLARIDSVAVGTNVDINDKIVCVGKAGIFPDNHPVGTVVAVRRDANGATMQIDVKLSDTCMDLSQVLVLPPLSN